MSYYLSRNPKLILFYVIYTWYVYILHCISSVKVMFGSLPTLSIPNYELTFKVLRPNIYLDITWGLIRSGYEMFTGYFIIKWWIRSRITYNPRNKYYVIATHVPITSKERELGWFIFMYKNISKVESRFRPKC